jgi:delta 1-pyrroline-5-carboxylate dehydrogenase
VGAEAWVDVFDPADVREPILRVPALTVEAVRGVYEAAESGFGIWRKTSPFTRARVLTDAAVLLRERAEEIAAAVVTENGKTLQEAGGEVQKAADFLEYYASVARAGYGDLLHDARPRTRAGFQREPLGVVLAITPWNDPLLTPARKLAPALAAGNAVVLKPATETPASALHFARALHDAGLPAGVLGEVRRLGVRVERRLVYVLLVEGERRVVGRVGVDDVEQVARFPQRVLAHLQQRVTDEAGIFGLALVVGHHGVRHGVDSITKSQVNRVRSVQAMHAAESVVGASTGSYRWPSARGLP